MRPRRKFGNDVSPMLLLNCVIADQPVDKSDDSTEVVGAPVSLQLVCQRLEEEKALKLTEIIAKALVEVNA